MAIVKVKVNGSTYSVTGIHYGYDFFTSGDPCAIELYIVNNFYYTPAPVSRCKSEKIWGQKLKPKKQPNSVRFLFPCTVEINKMKFKLDNKEERSSFTNYFYSLLALESL